MLLKIVKSLSRGHKRLIMLAIDSALVPLALAFALVLVLPTPAFMPALVGVLPIVPMLVVCAVLMSVAFGLASLQLNAYESRATAQTMVMAGTLGLASALLVKLFAIDLPASAHVVFATFYFVLLVTSRALLLQLVLMIYRSGIDPCRVLIYGAGTTGFQLVSALRSHDEIKAIAFVDDKKALQGLTIAGLPVLDPARIAEIVRDRRIDRVLLAMPSLGHPKQALIARRLESMGLEVQALPSFAQLIGKEALVDNLTAVHPSRFLNRAEVAATIRDSAAYSRRCILISGAGGSIGAELSRQVLESRPRRLVLFELNELALYRILNEITPLAEENGIEIVPVLGSVTDAEHVRRTLTEQGVEVVLHAAAYKHVPLVEKNPIAGLSNNVLGTQTLATQALAAGVDRFLLISSDKAVRPANVMGASKRLAELVVQDLATRVPAGEGPIFSIVRFGNVLGSSGSVIPLFEEQLRRGGPLTVTHPQVARYFMTVQEAVTLVLQAGEMAKGGEVFVLDMGAPVPIEQLARQIIENAGLTVRDDANPDGDIEIAYIGLRPGEKMREELTLTEKLVGTGHRKIFYAVEEKLSEIEVAAALRALRQALAEGDADTARSVALRWVEGYASPKTQTAVPHRTKAAKSPTPVT